MTEVPTGQPHNKEFHTLLKHEVQDILKGSGGVAGSAGTKVSGYMLSFKQDRDDYYLTPWPTWSARANTIVRFVEPGRDAIGFAALNVVKWWLNADTQLEAVKNGGQSGLMSVMSSPEYNDLRPWNRAHVEMIDWQKDVWHIPEFFELLTQQQEEFDKAITGQISAREALDSVAKFQQELLEDGGYIE